MIFIEQSCTNCGWPCLSTHRACQKCVANRGFGTSLPERVPKGCLAIEKERAL